MYATYVTASGDLNHDGLADLLISAEGDANIGLPGTVYVLFGGSAPMRAGFVDLAALSAPDGFVIEGPGWVRTFGATLNAGFDINADGIDDLAIAAPLLSSFGREVNGGVFVIFGRPGLGANGALDPTTLDGSNGFLIHGPSSHSRLGYTFERLGVLDYNSDGHPDLLLTSYGNAYLVFGGPNVGVSGEIDLGAWDDSMGVRFRGSFVPGAGGGAAGLAGVPGDVNGDGIDDVMFGAPAFDTPDYVDGGTTYIVFGGTLPDEDGYVDLTPALGNRAVIIYGPFENATMGWCWYAGDVNGDGYAEIALESATTIISYLVFGGEHANHVGVVELADADGTYASRIDNWTVRGAGDIDGDGIGDLIDSGPFSYTAPSDPPRPGAGVHYVAYGHADIGRSGAFTISDDPAPDEGFVIWGAHPFDGIGARSFLPDLNGDGVDEFVTRAIDLKRPDGTVGGGGYVIYGQRRFALGDFDRDRDVDLSDFRDFALCFNGPARPPAGTCAPSTRADFDNDGDVDLADYATFSQNFTGAK